LYVKPWNRLRPSTDLGEGMSVIIIGNGKSD